MQDCDTQHDDFSITSTISAGTANLLTECNEHNNSSQNEYAATRIFKFFSQLNLPDSFANFIIFVNFVLFSKTHYKKWGAVENRKFED